MFCVRVRLPEGELNVDEASLFDQTRMCEALTGSSYSAHIERFNTPYTPQLTGTCNTCCLSLYHTDSLVPKSPVIGLSGPSDGV